MNHYAITPISPEAHLYEVILTVSDPDPMGQELQMPAWIPGSYMIRDFAKNIVTLEVTGSAGAVPVHKTDKQTWRVSPASGSLTICYQVYAWDLSVRGAHLDTTHAYFNGAAVFLRLTGQQTKPCTITVNRPQGAQYSDWSVATTLPLANHEEKSDGEYCAGTYDELIDHPVEMGTYTELSFSVTDIPHEVAITGRHQVDGVRLTRDLKAICEQQVNLFGGLPEVEKYLFQVTVVGDGYGGLEHRSSTSLICKRDDLPVIGVDEVTDGYRQFLGLCSHEYFHLWNIKRIRPRVLMESDLTSECYTQLLWVFEGFTSYYDDLFLLRSGCIDRESYLELLARNITQLTRGTGHQKQTVLESSFDAWTKFYKQDENAPNAIVSYYTKGALIALLIDLTLRRDSNNELSLDDVMRALWSNYGQKQIGLEEGAAETLICEMSRTDISSLFDLCLRSTQPLPLQPLLEEFAIGCHYRAAKSAKDRGGFRKGGDVIASPPLVLGVRFKEASFGVYLTHVLDDGAAQSAGLAAGDRVVAVDGLSIPSGQFEAVIGGIKRGSSVSVHLFRRDELMVFEITPMPALEDTCELWVKRQAESSVQERMELWLNQPKR